MYDAVGEVLAQRQALDRGAGAGLALSLLLHGAITGAAVVAALRHPIEPSTPVIEIKFAPMPAPVQAPLQAPVAAPAPPQPKPQPVAPPQPAPVVKPVAKPVAASPYGKSTKKPTELPSIPATRQPAIPQPAAPAIPVGGTGAVVEGDFPYTIYIDRMNTLIGQHWFRPQAAAGITTTVKFVIGRDGTVRDAAIESESGNGLFDRAALRAVMEASPLPPLPFGYSGTYLNVHLTFK
jgi:TonB family protein